MWYWIIITVILLIAIEEGLYYASNRIAFNNKGKELEGTEETSKSRKRRRLRLRH
jgi:hypothetical protein